VRDRGRHVVAVADERNRPAANRPEPLLQRQEIRDRLTGMLLVRKGVDDVQPRRRPGELFERLLRERAD